MRWQVRKRMEFIQSKIDNDGYINRQDLMGEFEISVPQASTDFKTFQENYPDKINYNHRKKRYEKGA